MFNYASLQKICIHANRTLVLPPPVPRRSFPERPPIATTPLGERTRFLLPTLSVIDTAIIGIGGGGGVGVDSAICGSFGDGGTPPKGLRSTSAPPRSPKSGRDACGECELHFGNEKSGGNRYPPHRTCPYFPKVRPRSSQLLSVSSP